MRLKKLISSSLAIGLLFNSAPPSLASVILEDGRYETFEGNNITVNDVLEENKVDIEIEGNTLVNLLGTAFPSNSNIHIGCIYESLLGKTVTLVNLGDRPIYFETNHLNGEYKMSILVGANSTYVHTYINDDFRNILGHAEYGWNNNTDINHFKNSIMLLEGDWSNKEIPNYFEGMKSVGELEDNKIEISSQNKNLWDGTYEIGSIGTGEFGNGGLDTTNGENRKRSYYIPVKPNTKYTISQKDYNDIINDQIFIHQYDKNKNNILWNEGLTYRGVRENLTFTTDSNAYYLRFRTEDNRELNPNTIMIEESSIATPIVSSQSAKKEINLSVPLRGLTNGIKDRIIKRNGQWVIERNCAEVILDGSEVWHYHSYTNDNYLFIHSNNVYKNRMAQSDIISNNFLTYYKSAEDLKYEDNEYIWYGNQNKDTVWIYINKDKLIPYGISNNDIDWVNNFKLWLSDNPTTIVYQLEAPIYEPLNIDSTINLYEDTTHISNNSTIPANMTVTVDRTINRAVDAIKLAKTNPTVENLSKARMWINLLDDSIKKDELQEQINDITSIEDLQLEKKIATSNVDVYIKSENMLLMSLSTNSITFNNFSGVEDIELDNAVNISINSSLPYQLNSYLLTEIENADKSNRIEKDLLNIKLNSDSDYKTFNNINEKLILEDDCDAGNNKSHSIDFKLKGSQAHKADVYKTVIKFEAEQK